MTDYVVFIRTGKKGRLGWENGAPVTYSGYGTLEDVRESVQRLIEAYPSDRKYHFTICEKIETITNEEHIKTVYEAVNNG